MPNQLLWEKIWKKKKKRENKNQKMWLKKEKKWKKKKDNEGQYEHFYFQWLFSLGLMHVFCCIVLLKLYC